MLIVGGIYESTVMMDAVFIYLCEKDNIYYGLDIINEKLNSNKLVEDFIYDKIKYNSTYGLCYRFILQEKDFDTDGGYLGQINKDLYNYLLKILYKSGVWIK